MKKTNYLFLFFSLAFLACGKQYDAPPALSTSGFDPRGDRFVPNIGTPKYVTKVANEKLVLARSVFTSSPVSLSNTAGYALGTSNGEVIIFDSRDSLRYIISLDSRNPVVELLADQGGIVSLQLDGVITGLAFDGKPLWKFESGSYPNCNSMIGGNIVYVARSNSLLLLDRTKGNAIVSFPFTLSAKALAYSSESNIAFLALSWNNSEGSDSIVCLKEGKIISRSGFPGMRISSNLSLTAEKHSEVAFGYFGEFAQGGSVRKTFFGVFDGITEGKPVQKNKAELPYIVMNAASNGELLFASGFREYGGELASGIDCFTASKFEKRWQRRLSEPLVTPLAVSQNNVYFTLSFSTNAETPSSGIFYVLSTNDGKTEKEVPIEGARAGFAPGMPMPFGDGALMISDRENPIVYFIRP